MRKLLDRLYLAGGALAATFIALIAFLMIAQSVLREFRVKTGAVNDVVAWFCAAAAFFAMAHAFKHGDFVRVTLLLDKVGAKTRRVMELASLAIAVVAVAYLAFRPALSPTRAGNSTMSRRACCRCRCGFRSSVSRLGRCCC